MKHERHNHPNYSDADLLEAIKSKQSWALAVLYDRYAGRLFGLAIKILQDRSQAEDVLQDVFVGLWHRAESFEARRGAAASWLLRLCRNRCIDALRKRQVNRTRFAGGNAIESEQADDSLAANPATTAGLHEAQAAINQALSRLPEEQRRAIAMAYFDGLSQSEIATALQMPLGTVKTRIRLGMMKLRDLLRFDPLT